MRALVEEGTALRALLLTDLTTLRLHRLIPANSVGRFDARVGFKKLGFDLLTLATLLLRHWARIEHQIPLDRADLERASWLGDRIIGAVAARERAPKARAAAAEQRLRNFTLLVRAYDEVRRAIAFFQPKPRELEKIAPSLTPSASASDANPRQEWKRRPERRRWNSHRRQALSRARWRSRLHRGCCPRTRRQPHTRSLSFRIQATASTTARNSVPGCRT